MFSFAIASRSLGRNKRRMLVTTGATAFAGFIMVTYSTLMSGFLRTMEQSIVSMEHGDVQIHAKDYRLEPDLYKRISGGAKVSDQLSARGLSAAPRLYGFGLAAAGSNSSGVEIRGIDVERERSVTAIHRAVLEGRWLSEDAPKEVVLGKKVARSLDVKIGDEVVILGQASDGSMANDLYRVRGVLKSVSPRADPTAFFMTQAAFRELMVMPEGVHEIAINRGIAPLDEAKSRTLEVVTDHEVMTWRELQPTIAQMIDSSSAGLWIMLFITYAAVAMVILNATLMSVFERIREFGIMKAIGVGPGQVGLVILLEVLLQGFVASLIALATALPLSLYLEKNGWDLTFMAGDMNFGGIAWEPIWYAQVNFESVSIPIVALFAIVALAAAYPGAKAAFISPLRAIYHR
jgi:ABC-type lipoprotein release transport system permease subunit